MSTGAKNEKGLGGAKLPGALNNLALRSGKLAGSKKMYSMGGELFCKFSNFSKTGSNFWDIKGWVGGLVQIFTSSRRYGSCP